MTRRRMRTGCAAWIFFTLAALVVWWIVGTALPAHCEDNRYGYPTYRGVPHSTVNVLTVLGDPNIYVIDRRQSHRLRAHFDYAYASEARVAPRRWHAAPCRMQGPFAVDWREMCRSRTKR